MSQLVEYGEVKRGRIGIQIVDINPELAKNLGIEQTEGAIVQSLEKGSPAEAAGVKAGDVVIALDGKPVHSMNDLHNRIGLMTVGTTVDLTILRDKARKEIKVTIAKAPDEQKEAKLNDDHPMLEGASFENPDTGDKTKGVVVTQVERGSPAFQLGLRQGDRIVAVNRKSVNTLDDLKLALKDSGRQSALFVKRGDQDQMFVIQ